MADERRSSGKRRASAAADGRGDLDILGGVEGEVSVGGDVTVDTQGLRECRGRQRFPRS